MRRRHWIGRIRPIPPEAQSGWHSPRLLSGWVKPLRQAAIAQERLLQLPEQLIQEIVGLVNHAPQRVRPHFGRRVFNVRDIGLIGPVRCVVFEGRPLPFADKGASALNRRLSLAWSSKVAKTRPAVGRAISRLRRVIG